MRQARSVMRRAGAAGSDSPAKQLAAFIAKFDPAIAKLIRSARAAQRKRLPTAVVEALLRAAIAQAKTPLPRTGRGYTIIKSVSAKQRPRRTLGG